MLMIADAPDADHSDFPCSVRTGAAFWLLDRLEPGNSSYNVAVRWRLEGRVSSTAFLERAWLDDHSAPRSVADDFFGKRRRAGAARHAAERLISHQ